MQGAAVDGVEKRPLLSYVFCLSNLRTRQAQQDVPFCRRRSSPFSIVHFERVSWLLLYFVPESDALPSRSLSQSYPAQTSLGSSVRIHPCSRTLFYCRLLGKGVQIVTWCIDGPQVRLLRASLSAGVGGGGSLKAVRTWKGSFVPSVLIFHSIV